MANAPSVSGITDFTKFYLPNNLVHGEPHAAQLISPGAYAQDHGH